MQLTVEQVKANGCLIFEVISGSRAYGLDTATSDTDIKGVFVLPKEQFYGLDYVGQVNNASNDVMYYELKRFVELLTKNNPNMLELLCTPASSVLYKDPLMKLLKPEMFVSKLCEQSFGNYALTQIKKAYGLEKKIVQPVEQARKSVIDFCFVYEGNHAIPAREYFAEKALLEDRAGLTAIHHLRDCYNLYYSAQKPYGGLTRKDSANDVCLSNIPKGEVPIGLLFFNKDGYSVYCKKYKEYWDWVDNRNEERYNQTMQHGKPYDAKNMMHVFRLLQVAKEIAQEGTVNVFRKDRDFLLSIKAGAFEYDELVSKAKLMSEALPMLYEQSGLMDEPDVKPIEAALIKIRTMHYGDR